MKTNFFAGLSVIVTPHTVIQQDQFQAINTYIRKNRLRWPVYVVGTRPRANIVKDSVAQGKDDLIFSARLSTDAKDKDDRHYRMIVGEIPPGVVFVSQPPYRTLVAQKAADVVFNAKVGDMLMPLVPELREFNVLYIGQAVGEDEDYTVINRLSSHSTLQEIYFDVANENAHLEVCVIPCSVEPYYMGLISPFEPYDDSEQTTKQMKAHLMDDAFPFKQLVNVGEAALIRHFQPKYNTNFVKNFPDRAHVGYDQAYLLSYNMISAELCGEELDISFSSPSVSSIDHVLAEYSLVEEGDRLSMLEPASWFRNA